MSKLQNIAFTVPRSAVFSPRRFDRTDLGIATDPSFQIHQNDRVFCIGSCFARAVQRMLGSCAIQSTFAGLTHRYNIFTIEQTIRWAFDDALSEDHFIRLNDGSFFDPYDRSRIETGYQIANEAYELNAAQLRNVKQEVSVCDTLVITLGLAEVWRDTFTNAWLNHRPPDSTADPFDSRFRITQTTVAENRNAIVNLVRYVRSINPKAKFIFSVSPIALNATFTQTDVLVATMLGKATLRAAVHEAIAELARTQDRLVDYFPSFEIVMFQRNNDVYVERDDRGRRDRQHIREDFLHNAIRPAFLKAYINPNLTAQSA